MTLLVDLEQIRSRAAAACGVLAIAIVAAGALQPHAFVELVPIVASTFLAAGVVFARLRVASFSPLRFAAAMIGGAVAYSISTGGAALLYSTVPLLIVVAFVVSAYQWRDARSHETRETAWPMWSDTAKHLAAYFLAIAAAVVASAELRRWGWQAVEGGYLVTFLLTKLAIDTAIARPIHVVPKNLTVLLRDLTIISPIWWGLPIALLVYAHEIALRMHEGLPTAYTLVANLPAAYKTATAVTLVFAALTVIASFYDTFSRSKRLLEMPDEPFSQYAMGAMTFFLVAGVAAGAFAINYKPFLSFEDIYGVETWTCGKQEDGGYELGWIPKRDSVKIFVSNADDFFLFNVSCVPGPSRCEYTHEDLEQVDILIHSPQGYQTYRMPGPHPGATTDDGAHILIAAFRNGTNADISVYAKGHKLLYVEHVNLNGFGPALDQCIARWHAPQSATER